LCYEFQGGLLFVSIALWILDMDELEMFDFLENELHIVGRIGLSSKILEYIMSKGVASLKCF